MAGAVLLAVPVAVAALIGFGTSISGVAGGLSAVTSGPDAAAVSAPTRPSSLNQNVVSLASKQTSTRTLTSGAANGGNGGGGGNTGTSTGTGTGTGSGSGTSSGGSGNPSTPTISTPDAPSVPLPGGGNTGGASDQVNGTVNDVLGGVNNTVNGLLGR